MSIEVGKVSRELSQELFIRNYIAGLTSLQELRHTSADQHIYTTRYS